MHKSFLAGTNLCHFAKPDNAKYSGSLHIVINILFLSPDQVMNRRYLTLYQMTNILHSTSLKATTDKK